MRGAIRFRSLGAACFVAALLWGWPRPLLGQGVMLQGHVKDGRGNAISNASILLRCDGIGSAAAPLITTSDREGAYTLAGVSPLLCNLQASAPGLRATVRVDFTKSEAGKVIQTPDLVMLAVTEQSGAQAGATTPAAAAPPTFEASGIRGLIDPGGYSAPAGAAAATSLMSGMADMHRAGSGLATGATACKVEPGLLQAVHDRPMSVDANLEIADFYLLHGQPALALPFLDAARQVSPRDARISFDLARLYIAQEKFEQARTVLRRSTPTTPDAQAEALMAEADEGLGLFVEAAAQYRLARQIFPSVENFFGEGYEFVLAARLTAADEVFREGLNRFPKSARLLIGRGIAEYLQGQTAISVQTFLLAVAVDPANQQAYPFLTQAYLVSGEHSDRVRAALSAHLAQSPDDANAAYLLALELSRTVPGDQHAEDADIEALLRKAITLDPALVQAHFRLGILLARQTKNESAALEFEQALRLQPTLEEAHFRLAQIDRKLGRTDAANREMAIFRSLQPSGEAHNDGAQIDLRQFISVMHRGGTASVLTACQQGEYRQSP